MPYITPKDRVEIDSLVISLARGPVDTPGDLNYVFTTLALGYLRCKEKVGYAEMNEVVGVFETAKLEFYRRAMAPYENEKIKTNGDVY